MTDALPADPLVERFDLRSCLSCGACTRRCPSARAGGVRPDAVVAAVLDGEEPQGVWDCLLCHRCMPPCPAKIDIVMLMTRLRHRSALAGGAPERFSRTGAMMIREGRGFPLTERAQKQRAELGLDPVRDSDRAMRELGKIISRTRFAHE